MTATYVDDMLDQFVYDDTVCLITAAAFKQLNDYTRSQPTSPSPGRIYRKNLGWPSDMDDNWFVYVCALDPEDPNYVLHHGRKALIV